MFSAFPGKVQEELEELQTDFTRFRSMFDRGVSVQTLVTVKDIESQLKDLSMYAQVQFKHPRFTYPHLVLTNKDEKLLETLDTKHKTRSLRCLDGTRVDLIKFISEWARNVAELACNIL